MPDIQIKIDDFFEKVGKWKKELSLLRAIVHKTELHEELKWYQPCYTVEGKMW